MVTIRSTYRGAPFLPIFARPSFLCSLLFPSACVSHFQSFCLSPFFCLFVTIQFYFSPALSMAFSVLSCSGCTTSAEPHSRPVFASSLSPVAATVLSVSPSWSPFSAELEAHNCKGGRVWMSPGSRDRPGREPRLWHFSAAVPAGGQVQSLQVGNMN